ncbi:MAG: hypothetical protein WCG23_12070 [bacterium]
MTLTVLTKTKKEEKSLQQIAEELEQARNEIQWKAWHIETVTSLLTRLWDEKNCLLDFDAIKTEELLTSLNLFNQESKAINKITDQMDSLILHLSYREEK